MGLLVALLAALVVCAAAQYSGPQPCSFSPPPQRLPLPRCPPAGPGAPAAADVALAAAPVVYMHPLEPYGLQSPQRFFEAATLFYQDRRNESETQYQFLTDLDPGDPLALMWGSRQFASVLKSSKVGREEGAAVLAGAPLDSEGRSTAEVYYTVFEPSPDLWGFTYNLFFGFNGCSQQMFSLSINGTAEVLDMQVCPLGTHEADWERVSVLACKAGGAVKQVAYSQHSWQRVLDCEAGGCPMEGGHPVAYAALETHALYPAENNFWVYELVNASAANISLVNFGGMFLGDRARGGADAPRFVPTAANVLPIPAADEILAQNLAGWEWALFGGVWGGPLQGTKLGVECYYDNQARRGPCPPGHARDAYELGLSIFEKIPFLGSGSSESEEWSIKGPTNGTFYSDSPPGSAIMGPLTRSYTYLWMPEDGAPVSMRGQPAFCPGTLAADVEYEPTAYTASINTLVNALVAISAGCAWFAGVVSALLTLPALLDKEGGTLRLAVTRIKSLRRRTAELVSRTASKRWRRETGGGEGSAGGRQRGLGPAFDTAVAAAAAVAAEGRGLGPGKGAGAAVEGDTEGKEPNPGKDSKAGAGGRTVLLTVYATGGGPPGLESAGTALAVAGGVSEPQLLAGLPGEQETDSAGQPGGAGQPEDGGGLQQEASLLQQGRGVLGLAGVLSGRDTPPHLLRGLELSSQQELLHPDSWRRQQLGRHATGLQAAAAVVAADGLPPPRLWAHLHRTSAGSWQQEPAQLLLPGTAQQTQQDLDLRPDELATTEDEGERQVAAAACFGGGDGPAALPSPSVGFRLDAHGGPPGAAGLLGPFASPLAASSLPSALSSPSGGGFASPLLPPASPADGSCPSPGGQSVGSQSPGPYGPEVTAVVDKRQVIGKRHLVWAAAGFAMYIAGIVMLAHGTHQLYRLGKMIEDYIGGMKLVFRTIKIIAAASLALAGLFDVIIVLTLFVIMPKARQAWDAGACRMRGLCGWVARNSHAIHVTMAGLLIVVLSVAMVLFGIGLVALVAQLAMQLACAAVSRLSVTGIPLESLCVSLPPDLAVFIPGMGKVTLVCLWELVNTCFFLSDLLVWDLVAGAALLLWSHVIFLLLVTTSMWLHYQFRLSLRSTARLCGGLSPAASRATLQGN